MAGLALSGPGLPTDIEDSAVVAAVAGGERYLTFQLAGESYALPIGQVTEILEYRPLTGVPLMPPFIRGVLNLRGRVVPIVDLLTRFGQGSTEIARRTGIIILDLAAGDAPAPEGDALAGGMAAGVEPGLTEDAPPRYVGVLVDGVNKVMHLSPEDIEPAPALGTGAQAEVVGGMARVDGGFIVVLDLRDILTDGLSDGPFPA